MSKVYKATWLNKLIEERITEMTRIGEIDSMLWGLPFIERMQISGLRGKVYDSLSEFNMAQITKYEEYEYLKFEFRFKIAILKLYKIYMDIPEQYHSELSILIHELKKIIVGQEITLNDDYGNDDDDKHNNEYCPPPQAL